MERAWLRIKNSSAQWAKHLLQSTPVEGGALYCNVQHDRLGNKSHINKITLCRERRRGRGGQRGVLWPEGGNGSKCSLVCKSFRLNSCHVGRQLLTQRQTQAKGLKILRQEDKVTSTFLPQTGLKHWPQPLMWSPQLSSVRGCPQRIRVWSQHGNKSFPG